VSLLLALALQLPDEEGRLFSALGGVARRLVEQVGPSVVALEVDRDPDQDPDGANPAAGGVKDYYTRPAGLVSATVLEADGHLLTSYFNVSGTIRSLTAVLPSGRRCRARLLGVDKGNDVALVKIEEAGLPVLRTARADEVKTGRFAFVLGRAPDAGRVTITDGIVSAVHRMKQTAFQVDAEMNFGSAGGPVVDAHGRLLGIACRINPKASWGQSGGIGFVARIDAIERVLPELKAGKVIEKLRVPWIGIGGADSAEPRGVRIQEVYGGSPAEAARLKADDVITAVDGEAVGSIVELQRAIQARKIGAEVRLTILREGREQRLSVKLGENPNE
jgi:S1-C subfamily serine protease